MKRAPQKRESTRSLVQELLKSGAKRINQYVFGSEIGRGALSKVKLCYSTEDEKPYAVKIIERSRVVRIRGGLAKTQTLDAIRREYMIFSKLDHPNIVKLKEIIDNVEKDKLYMVMEYVDQGAVMPSSLNVTPLPLETARSYLRDIISGLEYLHRHHILHRDLKPANFLLSSTGHLKITDFGVSLLFGRTEDDFLHQTAGTPAFTAPEICTDDRYSGRAADVWAVGVTLFMFVFGKVPFIADNVPDLYKAIQNDPLVIPEKQEVPESLKELLIRLLDKNPVDRITITDMKVHPWVTANGADPFPIESVKPLLSEVMPITLAQPNEPAPLPEEEAISTPLEVLTPRRMPARTVSYVQRQKDQRQLSPRRAYSGPEAMMRVHSLPVKHLSSMFFK